MAYPQHILDLVLDLHVVPASHSALAAALGRTYRAKKGVPPIMHDLIIFRALFSDSILSIDTEVLLIAVNKRSERYAMMFETMHVHAWPPR